MRKQTRLVAVLSAAALLAIGASMTSFAATGWAEENGTWVYYDKNGDMVTDTWAKSGDNWFFLDNGGEMAIDQLIEDNNNYYYVDENGSMVTNRWVAIDNEDYSGDDDDPQQWWYYFQANGKALKGSDNNGVSLKTINGKKYTFDSEGRMLYGWVDTNGERQTGDDAWQNADYYFGDENDGAMTVGWKLLSIVDTNAIDQDNGNILDTAYGDEDQDRWFHFKTNGKKDKAGSVGAVKDVGINGKKYGFDGYGRMVAEWSKNAATTSTPSLSTGTLASSSIANGVESTRWKYYGTPENGARVTKGWFQVVPAKGLNSGTYNDDGEKWYYSNNDGKLVASELKTINGKKYAFDDKGSMISGLKFLSVAKNDKNTILVVHDGDYYDTESEFNKFANADPSGLKAGELVPNFDESNGLDYVTYCYYFGSGDDGSMKTGKQTVDIDGESYTFLFNKSGGTKGAGKFGEDKDQYYLNGKLLKAEKDDRYSVLQVEWTGTVAADATSGNGSIKGMTLLTTDKFVGGLGNTLTADVTGVAINGQTYTQKKDNAYYNIPSNGEDVDGTPGNFTYMLVNTSGKVETKNKDKAKDGNDRCYTVKNGQIIAVFEEN